MLQAYEKEEALGVCSEARGFSLVLLGNHYHPM